MNACSSPENVRLYINAGYNNKITVLSVVETLMRAIFSYVYCMHGSTTLGNFMDLIVNSTPFGPTA